MSSYTKTEKESNPFLRRSLLSAHKTRVLTSYFLVQNKLLQLVYIICGNLTVIFQFRFLDQLTIADKQTLEALYKTKRNQGQL